MEVLARLDDTDIVAEKREVEDWSERKAARCVLKRGDKIALLHVGKYSYHKLPGGGIEEGEGIEEALRREVREETGSEIEIGKELGKIIEHRYYSGTMQTSFCFLVEEVERGEPEFTAKEREDGFEIEWYRPEEAISILEEENPSDYEGKMIVARDLKFLQEAFRQKGSDSANSTV